MLTRLLLLPWMTHFLGQRSVTGVANQQVQLLRLKFLHAKALVLDLPTNLSVGGVSFIQAGAGAYHKLDLLPTSHQVIGGRLQSPGSCPCLQL